MDAGKGGKSNLNFNISSTAPVRAGRVKLGRSTNRQVRSPSPTFTPCNFPPEILSKIFTHIIGSWEGLIQQAEYLLSACLVCSKWRAMAAPLLWSDIVLCNNTSAQKSLDSPALGRYRSRKVHFCEVYRVKNRFAEDMVKTVLLGLEGPIEEVIIDGLGSCTRNTGVINMDIFCEEALSSEFYIRLNVEKEF